MKKNVICDIDGVILHNNDLIPGADRFVHRLLEQGSKLLFLTNYPAQTQKDLQNRFRSTGIEVPEECFYTSAMGTADFLKRQDGKKAYVIGEGALTHELYKAGFTITDIDRAGRYEPIVRNGMEDVRIVKDIYPPRMTLNFVVKGADGQVVAEGERKLVDHAFLMGTQINNNDHLRYEKRLIDDWLRREFKDNAALTATP